MVNINASMNVSFNKEMSTKDLNSDSTRHRDDDLFLLKRPTEDAKSTNTDDDDLLPLESTNENKQSTKPKETLLNQTVQHLFGNTSCSPSMNSSSSSRNFADEKLIISENDSDEQLLDLS